MATSSVPTDEIQVLDQLARLGMGMAERLHDVAMATTEPEALARLGVAYHHISRGVRQTLALRARFAAGWAPAVRAAEPATAAQPQAAAEPAAPPPPERIPAERTGWNEYERLDGDELLDELDRAIDLPEDEPLDGDRFEAAVEAGLARLRRGTVALRKVPKPAARAAPPAATLAIARPAAAPAPRRAGLMGGAAALRLADTS